MQDDNHFLLNPITKSVRGRFVIQEVIDSDRHSKDSKRKRRLSMKSSKFKLNAKTSVNDFDNTQIYVFDNITCSYISINNIFKQYFFLFNTMKFSKYCPNSFNRHSLVLPLSNHINHESEEQSSILISNPYEEYFNPHIFNYEKLEEKNTILKKVDVKRNESKIDITRYSPFKQPPLKQHHSLISFQMNRYLSGNDNENDDHSFYTIHHQVSLMIESQHYIKQTLTECCFEICY